ncbi:MAG: SUMF1/EgtB/PvdO family nonheme iron enzyme, partial [Gammaproteobacteria bacterium]
DLYSLLKVNPGWLTDLEFYFEQSAGDAPGTTESLPPALGEFAARASLRKLFTLHSPRLSGFDTSESNFITLKPDELRLYFTLTRRVEEPEVRPIAEMSRVRFEPQTVLVPAGPFLMGSTDEQVKAVVAVGYRQEWADWERPQHTVTLSECRIGKYPVQNLEYQTFVQATGRTPPSHWEADGKKLRAATTAVFTHGGTTGTRRS